MIVDGRAIAADILEETRIRAARLPQVPVVRAITANPSPATASYLRIKAQKAQAAGMRLEIVTLPESATMGEYEAAVTAPGADAVLIQLPLPQGIDSDRLVNLIPVSMDADVLSEAAVTAFLEQQESALLPPVVAAVQEVLRRTHVSVAGMRATVVGQGKLVGKPAAAWLSAQGAQVTVVTKDTPNPAAILGAQLLVLGAGSPAVVKAEDIGEGVVLIDAGTSEQGGQMVGDAHPDCAQKASVFTPVPGGIGPIAVACLFRNTIELLERSLRQP